MLPHTKEVTLSACVPVEEGSSSSEAVALFVAAIFWKMGYKCQPQK